MEPKDITLRKDGDQISRRQEATNVWISRNAIKWAYKEVTQRNSGMEAVLKEFVVNPEYN